MIVAECDREAALGQCFGFSRAVDPNAVPVARGLTPVGSRSGPQHSFSYIVFAGLRLLRSRTGRCGVPTSPLATVNRRRSEISNPGAYETPNARRSR